MPPPTEVQATKKFTFIDLFAGIGGMRKGFTAAGGKCVFSSEIDKFARQTYIANFGSRELYGDIRETNLSVPAHDVLLAGFPCQPFSNAGVSSRKHLKRPHGFQDKVTGTLFYDVAKILAATRPQAFLLENVKNLEHHDQGRTLHTILNVLQNDLGYHVVYKVLDASLYVPQRRRRIYIVGFRDDPTFTFDEIKAPKLRRTLPSILLVDEDIPQKYILSRHLWGYLQDYAKKHAARGSGFGYNLVDPHVDSITRTLSARYYKDGAEILISRGPRKSPRRLTPRECARLMGFPDSFKIPVSDSQAYKQFGNSVVVPVIRSIAKDMALHLN